MPPGFVRWLGIDRLPSWSNPEVTRALGETTALRGRPGSLAVPGHFRRPPALTFSNSHCFLTLTNYLTVQRTPPGKSVRAFSPHRKTFGQPQKRFSGPCHVFDLRANLSSSVTPWLKLVTKDLTGTSDIEELGVQGLHVKAARAREEMRMIIADDQTAVDQRPVRKTTREATIQPDAFSSFSGRSFRGMMIFSERGSDHFSKAKTEMKARADRSELFKFGWGLEIRLMNRVGQCTISPVTSCRSPWCLSSPWSWR